MKESIEDNKISLIDTHCHLFLSSEIYSKWPNESNIPELILEEANSAGVEKIILVGTDSLDNIKNIEFANKNENVYCAIGFHPSEILKIKVKQIDQLRDLLNNDKVVAIGEVGLDISYGGNLIHQKEFLLSMINLALEFNKPLILHIKDQWQEIYEFLKPFKEKVNAVFHCFTGDREIAQKLVEDGWILSFTNIISYPNNNELREVVKNTPLEKIMIETDAPFLPPQSRRGTICKPADVFFVAEEIARIKNISIKDVAKQTTKNAEMFFKLN